MGFFFTFGEGAGVKIKHSKAAKPTMQRDVFPSSSVHPAQWKEININANAKSKCLWQKQGEALICQN